MSLEEGSEIAFVEYYPTNGSDNNQYYIQVQSPISVHQTTPRTNNSRAAYYTGSSLDNTPDSVRGGIQVNTTPVRKIAPSTRTILQEYLPSASKNYLEESLSLATPYVLTPDKDVDQQLRSSSPDRAASLLQYQQDSGKRGRPRADVINTLMVEGSQSGSNIKCKICYR